MDILNEHHFQQNTLSFLFSTILPLFSKIEEKTHEVVFISTKSSLKQFPKGLRTDLRVH